MRLRDRFAKATNKGSYYVIPIFEDAEIIEQIADEFAIGFADWCKQEYDVENTPFHNKWRDVNGEYRESKELLEIYKKEKGL